MHAGHAGTLTNSPLTFLDTFSFFNQALFAINHKLHPEIDPLIAMS